MFTKELGSACSDIEITSGRLNFLFTDEELQPRIDINLSGLPVFNLYEREMETL